MPYRKQRAWLLPPDISQLDLSDPINAGLIGWWPLDRTFNGTSPDISAKQNTVTLTNSPPLTAGMGGKNLSFNGSNQYVSTSATGLLQSSGTLSFWFRPTWSSGDSTSHILFGCGDGINSSYFRIQHFTDNNWYIGWVSSGVSHRVVISSSVMSVVANRWYILTVAWANGGNTTVYLNGVAEGTQGSLTTVSLPYSLFMATWEGLSNNYAGLMGGVRLHNRAWSPAEVGRLYADPFAGLTKPRGRRIISGVSSAITISLSESGSAVDAISESMTAASSVSEGGAAADSLGSQAIIGLGEAGAAADILASVMNAAAGVSESGSAADAIGGNPLLDVGESGNAADTNAITWSGQIDLLEGATAVDAFDVTGGEPIPPAPIPSGPTGGFDAGPGSGFGKWFNLAYRAGPGLRNPNRTGLGAEIEALVRDEHPDTPERIVEQAIERLAEREAPDESAALAIVAEHEARYRSFMAERQAIQGARKAFIEAIEQRAREELERVQALRLAREDAEMVAILAAMW